MLTIEALDRFVSHEQQTADTTTTGPVVLVNIFQVDPADAEEFVAVWSDILSSFMASPGCISAQFHRGIAGSATFMNYAVWESVADYRAVFDDPGLQAKLAHYPEGTIARPHLFQRVAVRNVCLGER